MSLYVLFFYLFLLYIMSINQLFTRKPSDEIIERILTCFDKNNIGDTTEFSQIDMNLYNTLTKFELIKNDIADFYLPCKKDIYMKDINYKSIITIARQFLKTKGYTIDSREKFIKSKKYLMYRIITQNEKQLRGKNKIIISFD